MGLIAPLVAALAVLAVPAPAGAVVVGQCATTVPSWGFGQLCRGSVGYGVTIDDRRTDGFCVELRRTRDGRTWIGDPGLRSCGSTTVDGEFPLTPTDRLYGLRLYRTDGAFSTICDGTSLPVAAKTNC
jgi:hypothetical protein